MAKKHQLKSLFSSAHLSNTSPQNSTSSPEPNDGTFISYDSQDAFSAKGTVRYGEEVDVDDL